MGGCCSSATDDAVSSQPPTVTSVRFCVAGPDGKMTETVTSFDPHVRTFNLVGRIDRKYVRCLHAQRRFTCWNMFSCACACRKAVVPASAGCRNVVVVSLARFLPVFFFFLCATHSCVGSRDLAQVQRRVYVQLDCRRHKWRGTSQLRGRNGPLRRHAVRHRKRSFSLLGVSERTRVNAHACRACNVVSCGACTQIVSVSAPATGLELFSKAELPRVWPEGRYRVDILAGTRWGEGAVFSPNAPVCPEVARTPWLVSGCCTWHYHSTSSHVFDSLAGHTRLGAHQLVVLQREGAAGRQAGIGSCE